MSGDARTQALHAAFAAIRRELGVPEDFAPEVEREAAEVATAPQGPVPGTRRDCTDLDFFTIDPPGSMDLDQAICLERTGGGAGRGGFHLRYAIADVPRFVVPGGAVDAEARRRGVTVYLPDARAPLHPPVLSEGAASLLPGRDRPAYVWDLVLDAAAEPVSTAVYPATVRSRARLDYDGAQAALDAGTAEPALVALAEFGRLRAAAELARGGASLPKPEQEVVADERGFHLRFRPLVPLEDYNAQVSLLTGMAAAAMMLEAGVGILRTMPAPPEEVVAHFRRRAQALGVPWPEGTAYGAFLRTLDRFDPAHLAVVHAATKLFRGAGYAAFDEAAGRARPEQTEHAAVAAPYAHVTAPLRRLVDRFGLVVCAALSAGEPVPDWVTQALPTLPDVMRERDQVAGSVERAATDAVEAAVLSDRVGTAFTVTVVDVRPPDLRIQLTDPAVEAPCGGRADPGTRIDARLVEADIARRAVRFEKLGGPGG